MIDAHPRVSAVRAERRLTFLAALFLLSACSITAPSGRTVEANELARNRERWASAQLHDYEYDYQLICFCAPDATEQVHVIVRHDTIATVTRTRDGLPAARQYTAWPRVDDLFDDVQRHLDRHVARLDVSYDPTYGYPRSIVVDVELTAADDESQQIAGNLRPVH
jgi:hypothetical protein